MSKNYKLLIIFVALFFALVHDWLFNGFGLGPNFIIYISGLLCIAIIIKLILTKKIVSAWSFLFCIPIIWYAATVAIYENQFVHIVAPLASIFLLILFAFWFGAENKPLKKVERILPLSLLTFIGTFFIKITATFKGFRNVNMKKTNKIILAIVIVLPLLLIFGALFASADLIFRKILLDAFNFEIDPDLAIRTLKILFLFLFFNGAFFTFLFKKRFTDKEPESTPTKLEERSRADEDNKEKLNNIDKKSKGTLIPNIILGTLNIFFLAFIAIQIMFLFGGHEVITQYNISYAQYVHQGFYQMTFISILVLIISYILYRVHKSKKLDSVKILTAVFIGQTLIIVASALKRMFLYQEAYGLTQLRFLVWHFIIYMGLILLTLLIVVLLKKHYALFIKFGLAISIIYLMFMTGINMEAKIARVNIDRYISGQDDELDIQYLNKLSTDIYDQIKRPEIGTNKKGKPYFDIWAKNQSTNEDQNWKNLTKSKLKYLSDKKTQ
ncbi:MAG: DUF4173 domain-containing protein [Patescibacteria group bacterium]